MFRERGIIFGVLILFSLGIICAAAVENSLHLTIQTTNATGVTTGTFAFVFNISSSSDCANVVYSNSTTLTTDNRGIISYYLENVVLDFSTQYWLCYYRNGTLINATKLAKTPYSFSASNISTTGGLNIAGNLNISGKLYVNGTSYSSNYINPIVASGNNSNGSYIKYIDGTMIAWGNVSVASLGLSASAVLGTTSGTTYWAIPSVTYPIPFVSAPYAYATADYETGSSAGLLASVQDVTATSMKIFIGFRGESEPSRANWYAIGKWTNTPYDNSTITVGGGIPAGAIVAYNRTSCPVGWTLADGSSGTPDLRGIFIRGSGTNSILKYANGSYFSSVFGTYGNDSFQGHYHRQGVMGNTYSVVGIADFVARAAATGGSDSSTNFLNSNPRNASTDGINGEPRTGAETSPAYYSTIYCVKMTEDTATSNTIWATSGNNVLLSNSSMKLNLPTISNNLTLSGNTPVAKFLIPFVEGSSTAGKIIFTNQDAYTSGMAGIRSELYSQENDNGNLIFSAMSVNTLLDIMTINGQGVTIHKYLTITGQGSTINQSDWIAPTFQNSWVNYGSVFSVTGYMKDSMGFVHLQGLVKSGTIGQCIFTLPAGYRPQYQEIHIVQTNSDTYGRLDITTAGCVQASVGSNAWFSLDGVTFRAYQ